jgi:TPR repeat protein/V8-like Glu-specific endopeptidase
MRVFSLVAVSAFVACVSIALAARTAIAQPAQCLAQGFLPGSTYGAIAVTLPQSVMNQWAGQLGLLRPVGDYANNDVYRQRSTPIGRLDVSLDNGCMQVCTATLLPDGHIITAGHCFKPRGLDTRPTAARVVFDHYSPADLAADVDAYQVDLDSVYSLEPIEVQGERQIVDVAIAKLNRTPANREPVTLLESIPEQNTSLYMISHPLGLPKRIALTDCRVEQISAFRVYHRCDTVGGSSGAPFLDTGTHRILGIHTDGAPGLGSDNYGWLIAGFVGQIRARYGQSFFEPVPVPRLPIGEPSSEGLSRAIVFFEARNWGEAAPIFTRLANQNDPTAQAYLGRMYIEGLGVVRDDARAVGLLRASSAQNNPIGQKNFADSLRVGRGIIENPTEARRLYQLAAEAGYAPAQYELGVIYNNDYVNSVNSQAPSSRQAKDAMLRWWRAAAEQDNIEALYGLGRFIEAEAFKTENTAEKSALYAEAFRYMRRAAQLGNANALASIGNLYRDGKGVPKDDNLALDYYQQALAAGYPYAQVLMGTVYFARGGTANYAEARRLFEAAGDFHEPDFYLAEIHFQGLGVPKDYRLAADYYLQYLRSFGYPSRNLYRNLTSMYRTGGHRLQRNRVAAFQWAVIAADQAWRNESDQRESLVDLAIEDWDRMNRRQQREAITELCARRGAFVNVGPVNYVECPGQSNRETGRRRIFRLNEQGEPVRAIIIRGYDLRL